MGYNALCERQGYEHSDASLDADCSIMQETADPAELVGAACSHS
jgi:hypothetical protein